MLKFLAKVIVGAFVLLLAFAEYYTAKQSGQLLIGGDSTKTQMNSMRTEDSIIWNTQLFVHKLLVDNNIVNDSDEVVFNLDFKDVEKIEDRCAVDSLAISTLRYKMSHYESLESEMVFYASEATSDTIKDSFYIMANNAIDSSESYKNRIKDYREYNFDYAYYLNDIGYVRVNDTRYYIGSILLDFRCQPVSCSSLLYWK